VKAIGPDVLRHRVLLSYEAEPKEVTAEDIVRKVFEVVEVRKLRTRDEPLPRARDFDA
jgi:hypothetical protein